ncbi:uncharacterized protein TNCV_3862321 [Trichonephila clavipes]|nr:uncharacterized protein TNCV_3862321 [Trichonephila clavipes]
MSKTIAAPMQSLSRRNDLTYAQYSRSFRKVHLKNFIFQSSCKSSSVVGGRSREVGGPGPPPGVLPQNWGGNKPNRTVTCMVLKATVYNRRHLALCHDEFRGPRSGLCRSVCISNNNTTNASILS